MGGLRVKARAQAGVEPVVRQVPEMEPNSSRSLVYLAV